MNNQFPFEKIKRKILTKQKAETDTSFGCKPDERSVKEIINYGIINLNKPSGPTSHQVSDYVQKILHIKKAGHSGTLDPRVTGVQPIALGESTRITQTLLKAGKEYVCLMHLHKKVPQSKIHQSSKKFIGKLEQLPPLKSAVKREKRIREVYYLGILEIEDKDVLFRVGTEAGTYIRRICDDWGKLLGTGAHMAELVRTRVGSFSDKDWITLYDLKDAYELYKENNEDLLKKIIRPVESAVEHLPKIWVFDNAVDSLAHGASLSVPGVSKLHSEIKENDIVAVLTLKDELICLGKSKMDSETMLKEEKGVAVKTEKVFMKRGVYPKFKKI